MAENTPTSPFADSPAGWVDPPMPPAGTCGRGRCTNAVEAVYVPPLFVKGVQLLNGTGKWLYPPFCEACEQTITAERERVDLQARVAGVIKEAGFAARYLQMTLANFEAPDSPAVREAIESAKDGRANLFIFGATGNGKTHLAVALLRHDIETTGRQGYVQVVPDLMAELRKGSRSGADTALIRTLCAAGALVLDDMGVQRTTDYALETVYRVMDCWYREMKKGLYITSNKSLDWLSENLDDRIASRISGMCRVIEMTGPDRRVQNRE